MNILDKIVITKKKEVALKKQVVNASVLKKSTLFDRDTFSLANNLKNSTSGIIAEFKRKSPSKPIINNTAKIQEVATGYELAGVCGMSVLTDTSYFGGCLEDLLQAREKANIPLLRKEFIIDEYQLFEAKAYGADVILLIAAILTQKEIKEFSELAKQLGLEVLLEVHNQEELQKSIMPSIDMIGVNNRNLKTFEVSTHISKELSTQIPNEFVKVSESGISAVKAIKDLQPFGYQGFLIGENFMKTNNPGESAKQFIAQL